MKYLIRNEMYKHDILRLFDDKETALKRAVGLSKKQVGHPSFMLYQKNVGRYTPIATLERKFGRDEWFWGNQ